MRALDLFCGAGGASMGLHRAGFEVVGVDYRPQPRYPFEFHCANALDLPIEPRDFDFIWASPPCQAHTSMRTLHNAKKHETLVEHTRGSLNLWKVPWIIENVVGAPLFEPVTLCGSMFGLSAGSAQLRRHRIFEASFPLLAPECRHEGETIGIYGGHARNRSQGEGFNKNRRNKDFSIEEARAAMGIDWMTLAELSQAIPPAYSEFIARAWMAQQ